MGPQSDRVYQADGSLSESTQLALRRHHMLNSSKSPAAKGFLLHRPLNGLQQLCAELFARLVWVGYHSFQAHTHAISCHPKSPAAKWFDIQENVRSCYIFCDGISATYRLASLRPLCKVSGCNGEAKQFCIVLS